jgi:hypothetical protein
MTTFYDSENRGKDPWNQLDERFFAVTIGIVTLESSFSFKMIENTVDRLIDTGVISHIIKTRVLYVKKYPKDESEPKILNVDDLLFGFNIFLGFCGISGLVFCFELALGIKVCRKNMSIHLLRMKFSNRKVKHAKVHPMNTIISLICFKRQKLSLELIDKFKVKQLDLDNVDEIEVDLGFLGEQ